ncbi:hypothetical protein G6O69_28630 [Pseudenhygromyxa sp. WMMC2535]|uniref:hypothetical protein n=1 Tax=Pseudenhygromyxa sp. WMMC2535 TaxID=2712867 RepID=UPI0015581ACA|nr:hypothetical protein [Pseudenhygromyxa sp. WMMC2535]NVB41833.1 hypothetical protein [Pseudenhygromyxa sp. WMMC2535]
MVTSLERTAAVAAFRLLGIGIAAGLGLGALEGCGKISDDSTPQRVHDEGDRELLQKEPPPPPDPELWRRGPARTPASMARFTQPDLSKLDGHWVVASDIPGQRELWIFDSSDEKLLIVDRHGRERINGLVAMTPCTLRVTDEYGRTSSRLIAADGDQLYVSAGGAVAITTGEGEAQGVLACVGHHVYERKPTGECVDHNEMLGIWRENVVDAERCVPGRDAWEIDGHTLTLLADGLWLDEKARALPAQRFEDRRSAELALNAAPEPTGDEDTGTDGSETGESETSSPGKPEPSDAKAPATAQ